MTRVWRILEVVLLILASLTRMFQGDGGDFALPLPPLILQEASLVLACSW